MILPRVFYARPTLEVAQDLVGHVLVHDTRAGTTAGVIVEVEAYIGESDPACHAAPVRPGATRRSTVRPGIAYVYLNYGMHYLVNAVTEPEGSPAAVLIRALEPLEGESLMRRRRARGTGRRSASFATAELCRGPGNLTRALGISLGDNERDLDARPAAHREIGTSRAPRSPGAAASASTWVWKRSGACSPREAPPCRAPTRPGASALRERLRAASGAGCACPMSARSGPLPRAGGRCAAVPA